MGPQVAHDQHTDYRAMLGGPEWHCNGMAYPISGAHYCLRCSSSGDTHQHGLWYSGLLGIQGISVTGFTGAATTCAYRDRSHKARWAKK